jgi:hypothetical protein
MLIEIGVDETKFGAIVCRWDEGDALRLIRDQLADLQRAQVEDGREAGVPDSKLPTEDHLQWLLDDWMREAPALLQEYAPLIFFSAQARVVFVVLSKLVERHFGTRDVKEWRKSMSALFKKKENEMLGVRRGREAGKKDTKPRKPRRPRKKRAASVLAERSEILAAIREIGQEPVYKSAVAHKLDISVKTLRDRLEKIREKFGDDWEDLVAKGLRRRARKSKK